MLDKTVGFQHFRNDISLSDQEITTALAWADGSMPTGDPKDMPAARSWSREEEWHIGQPDLIVTSP
jgi:hypothetical protein